MRHNVDGRKFGRNTSHRVAMLKNVANACLQKEQIVTTVQKAKEARRVVDRLITLGKSGTEHAKRLAFDRTRDKNIVEKLFGELAKRYAKRAGGYTRVLRMSERRRGDAAAMAVLELVDHPEINRKRQPKAAKPEAEGADAPKAADPLKGFKKMFGAGRGKVAGGGNAPKAPKQPKSTTRKTMAGGGSSKSGSSS